MASRLRPDVANFGWVRPPLVHLVAILMGSGLEVRWPLPFLPRAPAVALGCILGVGGIALFIHAMRTFRAAGTPVPGNLPTTTIVRTGPYRFSRNPIYVAFSLLHLGVALCVDSLWLVFTLAAAISVMAFVVIPREERYLEERFGGKYLDYKRLVRRWL